MGGCVDVGEIRKLELIYLWLLYGVPASTDAPFGMLRDLVSIVPITPVVSSFETS